MIAVQKLTKKYDKIVALDDVSFDVEKGEIVGLLGHNGAGKTTAMKIMTGFLEPTNGTVSVGGIDVQKDRIGVQKQIGYLPESAPLYPEMLVQEYLQMMCDLRSLPREAQRKAISRAVHATGLEPRLVQPIGTLSKGFRQRVGLAQAILHDPDLLVLDEPTNGLDPVQIVEIRALIRDLAKTSTVILSTHILPEIEAVCDRVVILIDGRVAADSKLDDLLASNEVRIAVAEGTDDVAGVLRGVEGVSGIKDDHDSSDGFAHYRATVTGPQVRPAIVKAAIEAGWDLGEITPLSPSLETVFRDLHHDHVAKMRGKGAAA